MQPPVGDPFYLTGEFREVDPPARLAYTFVWEDPDPDDVETLVVLSFRDLGGSTEAALTQGPFTTEARHALHRNGWTESFRQARPAHLLAGIGDKQAHLPPSAVACSHAFAVDSGVLPPILVAAVWALGPLLVQASSAFGAGRIRAFGN